MLLTGLRNKPLVLPVFIRRDRLGVLDMVPVHPGGEWGAEITDEVSGRVKQLTGNLSHSGSSYEGIGSISVSLMGQLKFRLTMIH